MNPRYAIAWRRSRLKVLCKQVITPINCVLNSFCLLDYINYCILLIDCIRYIIPKALIALHMCGVLTTSLRVRRAQTHTGSMDNLKYKV